MTRTMYDSVTAFNIPASAQMVAGYVDGRYVWSASDWARFPGAVKVRIAVFASTNDGVVLDVEPGDATPAQAPGWVQRRRAAGVDPTVYCSASSWPSVRAAFQAAGVPEPHYWIAAYPGIGPALYPGSVAHQYADPGPYDVSVVADYWPGVDASTVSNVTTTGWATPTAPGDLTATAPEDDMFSADDSQRLIDVANALGRLETIYGAADQRNRAGEIDETHDWTKQTVEAMGRVEPLVTALRTGSVDTQAIVDALLGALPAADAKAVADELAKRLAG